MTFLQCERLNITDLAVIIVLGTALIMAIFYNLNELAMSIASGMIGYIGGAKNIQRKGEDESGKIL